MAPSPAPNGFINCTVTVGIERGSDGYVSIYQKYYEQLWFSVGGFGNTEAEALEDFLSVYHEVMIDALKEGLPIPILRFRFVRRGRKGKKS